MCYTLLVTHSVLHVPCYMFRVTCSVLHVFQINFWPGLRGLWIVSSQSQWRDYEYSKGSLFRQKLGKKAQFGFVTGPLILSRSLQLPSTLLLSLSLITDDHDRNLLFLNWQNILINNDLNNHRIIMIIGLSCLIVMSMIIIYFRLIRLHIGGWRWQRWQRDCQWPAKRRCHGWWNPPLVQPLKTKQKSAAAGEHQHTLSSSSSNWSSSSS